MAGSIAHTIDDDGKFIGIELLDNLGDAYEAIEEYYKDRIKLQEQLTEANKVIDFYASIMIYGWVGYPTITTLDTGDLTGNLKNKIAGKTAREYKQKWDNGVSDDV